MRGVALTLAVLIMLSYLALVYESRIRTLCCARKVHLLELRLARLYRISTNLKGVIYYNALRLIYSDPDYLLDPPKYMRTLRSAVDVLCSAFARMYSVRASCKILSLRGPFELNDVPSAYVGASGYVKGATCYQVCINLTLSDKYVWVIRSECFLLCHPIRYFAIKRAFNLAIEEAMEEGCCSEGYIRSYIEGTLGDVEILAMNVSAVNNCLTVLAVVRDYKAEELGIWSPSSCIVKINVTRCRLKE